MTTESNDGNTTTEHPAPAKKPLRVRLRWLLLGPAVLLGGAFFGARRVHALGHGPFGHGDFTPEEVEALVGKRIERALHRLDATPQQKEKVKEMVARFRPELRALHECKRKLYEAGRSAFGADRVDPQEIERIRREALALADKGSGLAARAATELGQILTAEQRRRVLEHFGRHRRGR